MGVGSAAVGHEVALLRCSRVLDFPLSLTRARQREMNPRYLSDLDGDRYHTIKN